MLKNSGGTACCCSWLTFGFISADQKHSGMPEAALLKNGFHSFWLIWEATGTQCIWRIPKRKSRSDRDVTGWQYFSCHFFPVSSLYRSLFTFLFLLFLLAFPFM